jgi:hypothetical protein
MHSQVKIDELINYAITATRGGVHFSATRVIEIWGGAIVMGVDFNATRLAAQIIRKNKDQGYLLIGMVESI